MRSLSAMINGEKSIIIAAAVEAAQKISAPSSIKDHLYKFELGSEIERREVLEVLQDLGYERVDQVERSGHFSVRGDIVDIYPINEIHPVRIEFFGDEIDSIRLFDVDSQRSIETLESQSVFPVAVKGSKNSSVLSYLDHGIVFYDEPQRGEESLKQFFKEEKPMRARLSSGASSFIQPGNKRIGKLYSRFSRGNWRSSSLRYTTIGTGRR